MKALIIDENPAEADALCQLILDAGYYSEWAAYPDSGEARARLKDFNVVISDVVVPNYTPQEVVDTIARMHNSPRHLVVTVLERGDPSLKVLPTGTRILYSPCQPEEIVLAALHEAGLYRLHNAEQSKLQARSREQEHGTNPRASDQQSGPDSRRGQATP